MNEKKIEELKDALIAIGQALETFLSRPWESMEECVKQLEEERYNCVRQVWSTVWDTRKKSQVISNKPRFMFRKIIR